jgi:hypothetical protein
MYPLGQLALQIELQRRKGLPVLPDSTDRMPSDHETLFWSGLHAEDYLGDCQPKHQCPHILGFHEAFWHGGLEYPIKATCM